MEFAGLLRGPSGDTGDRSGATTRADLQLEPVFGAVVQGREEYDLLPIFRAPSGDLGVVEFRQAVFRDLERPAVRTAFEGFAGSLRSVRRSLALAQRLPVPYQGARWFLDAVREYVAAARRLSAALAAAEPRSRGLRELGEFLTEYLATAKFLRLAEESDRRGAAIAALRYTLRIEESRVTVGAFAGQAPFSAEVAATFARFPSGARERGTRAPRERPEMDPVEEAVQARVALLFPREFAELAAFRDREREFFDPTVARVDREIQFYLAWLDHVRRLTERGVPFCYPSLSERSKEERVLDAVDLALVGTRADPATTVVANDVAFHGAERILVVTGPNNGGKTTYARMVGQLHYVAQLGAPVPAREASLLLVDRVLTHFERGEPTADLRGNLLDELVRVHELLAVATDRSLLVLNETFGSAALEDALFLGREVLERIARRDALAVFVTFLDELAALGPATASLGSVVSPEHPEARTYRFRRQPATGQAYALALAERHGLTYEALRRRLPS
ncbi:MAG TPA: DNA mismatch repair protein MutS [Thermoplasmata archaeon]|nr:DNA mismatch repair protein MutS [Thermoplasmata archaeon]